MNTLRHIAFGAALALTGLAAHAAPEQEQAQDRAAVHTAAGQAALVDVLSASILQQATLPALPQRSGSPRPSLGLQQVVMPAGASQPA
jgi:hypothetical protein